MLGKRILTSSLNCLVRSSPWSLAMAAFVDHYEALGSLGMCLLHLNCSFGSMHQDNLPFPCPFFQWTCTNMQLEMHFAEPVAVVVPVRCWAATLLPLLPNSSVCASLWRSMNFQTAFYRSKVSCSFFFTWCLEAYHEKLREYHPDKRPESRGETGARAAWIYWC